MRPGNWKPATLFANNEGTERTNERTNERTERTEAVDDEAQMEDYAEEVIAVETVAPEKKRRPQREKYIDVLKKNANPKAVLEDIMD